MSFTEGQVLEHPKMGRIVILEVADKIRAFLKSQKREALLIPDAALLTESTLVVESVSSTVPPSQEGKKTGYAIPEGLPWALYQAKAEQGFYSAKTPYDIDNAVDPRRIEHDIKHLMFEVAKREGATVETIHIPVSMKVGTSEGDEIPTEIRLLVRSFDHIVVRLRTDEGNRSQDVFAAQLAEEIEKRWPTSEGWTLIDGHEKGLKKLTGYNDVKEALIREFLNQIRPFLK